MRQVLKFFCPTRRQFSLGRIIVILMFLAGFMTTWLLRKQWYGDQEEKINADSDKDYFAPEVQYQIAKGKMDLLNLGTKRLVHLDLKGAPLKISFLEELFPVLRLWGATGLLVEWEDTFPYWSELSMIGSEGPDSPGVYSKHEVEELLSLAQQHELEVVPLVQTFGHLEFVLKHDKFREMREVENFPSSLCPLHKDSLDLVKTMLSQVVQLHPNLQTLHIGADEVWHMGLCEKCKSHISGMQDNEGTHGRDRLFLEHVSAILRWLHNTHPNIQVVMWDDMLRHIDPLLMKEYEFGTLVEPMVWHYRDAESFYLPDDIWPKYSSVFDGVWVATAFKGASGSNALLPKVIQHIECQEHWLQVLENQHEKGTLPKLKGLAITGWSRYDHYAVMCELLPVGLPSLALCLAQWQARAMSTQLHKNVSRLLGYPDDMLIPLNAHKDQKRYESLAFPGWRVSNGVEWFAQLKVKINEITESDQLQEKLTSLEKFLRPGLNAVMPPLAVEEWLGTALEPTRDRLRQLVQDAERQMALGGRIRDYKSMA